MNTNEKKRLEELAALNVMDTLPEKEFDEVVELASTICGTQVSLITLLDGERQWFKAKKGLDISQTERKDAFCHYTIQDPDNVMVVEDLSKDERFRENPFVANAPNARFYAGAPLRTVEGNAVGTICVIDVKPQKITEQQANSLRLLAKRVMEGLYQRQKLQEQKEVIRESAKLLTRVTDNAPGAAFQMEMDENGKLSFPFVSHGISKIHPSLSPNTLRERATQIFSFIHNEDREAFRQSIAISRQTLSTLVAEYRIITDNDNPRWVWVNSIPEKQEDGKVVWYGNFLDVTEKRQYVQTLEDICFDISHVIRSPVATIIGLSEALERDELSEEKIQEYAGFFKKVAEEMDRHIEKLGDSYNAKRSVEKAKGANNRSQSDSQAA